MGAVDSAAGTADAPGQPVPDDPEVRERPDEPDRSLADLRNRINDLPAGHPSSPYDADGSSRQPAPRLRDLDTSTDDEDGSNLEAVHSDQPDLDAAPVADTSPDALSETAPQVDAARPADQNYPLTDAEWTGHVTDIRGHLDKAAKDGITTNRLHTLGPDHKEWTQERNRIQGEIVADLYEAASDVPCSGRAIITGGLGGAGKSTVLADYANIDRSQYLTINPDDIKEEMARRGLIPEVEGLSPMEASGLAHEEASFIAKRLGIKAAESQKNVIWDITMSSRESTETRINELRDAGYSTVDGIFVDIPIEVSDLRVSSRHREGHDNFLAGIGLGGRYVPTEITHAQADELWGSKNRRTFEEVKDRFDRWTCFDNSIEGRPAVVVEAHVPGTARTVRRRD